LVLVLLFGLFVLALLLLLLVLLLFFGVSLLLLLALLIIAAGPLPVLFLLPRPLLSDGRWGPRRWRRRQCRRCRSRGGCIPDRIRGTRGGRERRIRSRGGERHRRRRQFLVSDLLRFPRRILPITRFL